MLLAPTSQVSISKYLGPRLLRHTDAANDDSFPDQKHDHEDR